VGCVLENLTKRYIGGVVSRSLLNASTNNLVINEFLIIFEFSV